MHTLLQSSLRHGLTLLLLTTTFANSSSCDAGRMIAVTDESTTPNTGGANPGSSTEVATGGTRVSSSNVGGSSFGTSNVPRCTTVGGLCEFSRDCCSGACAKIGVLDENGQDLPRCQGVSGCRPAGEPCQYPDECCSRSCVLDQTGTQLRCEIGRPDCLEPGELCGPLVPRNFNCCGEPLPDAPICSPAITGVYRCRKMGPNGDPVPDAWPCATSAECRGRFCLPAEGGATRCSSLCVFVGQTCRASTDCCTDTGSVACLDERCTKIDANCRQIGQPCAIATDCCNGRCRTDNIGGSFCAPNE